MLNTARTGLAWCLLLLFSLGSAWAADSSPRPSETLDRIVRSGKIRIGIKTDVYPFGFLNKEGQAEGFEIEMAADVAKRLGVELNQVSVRTENRFQKLELGEVDVLIATVGDSLQRRQVATAIEPGYFQAGVTVMLRPGLNLKDWSAMRGRTICALQGAYFNRPIAERHILNLQTYKTVRDALLAVKEGYCDGYLYNRPVIQRYLADPEYANFTAPFPDVLVTPWAIFIGKSDAGTDLEIKLGDMVADWYRNGFIKNAAKKWDIQYGADWPDAQMELWNRKKSDGSYFCQRDERGHWPVECRKAEFVTSTDVSGLSALGLRLKEQLGIDVSYVYDQYDQGQLVRGIFLTLLITFSTILATLLIGVLGAVLIEARIPLISGAISAMMALMRYNPPILMMYLLFFGFGGLLLNHYDVRLPAFLVAVYCLSVYSAGIVVSALRDAANHLRASDPGYCLSLKRLQDAIGYARWPIKQALINGTKMSMICSAIAVPEVLSATNAIMAEKGNFVVMMLTLVIIYYCVSSFWVFAFDRLETFLYSTKKAGQ